ncbi:hypothetical protein F2P81_025324 [Scophthalmus maximus]|uniref:Arf-GAP domain-containing protein n=1 Tax=Scophthalmus maximus TaxID=52904 RepID=A0A6A4RTS2_SCOMX|nr:hypothetical protein F2P81_025324 [Scophthalmus maximus]
MGIEDEEEGDSTTISQPLTDSQVAVGSVQEEMYHVQQIKKFLQKTKHCKNVKFEDHFGDKMVLLTSMRAQMNLRGPRWASWNLGIFICIRCAGIHRNLGVHISKVKSVNLDQWTQEQVQCVQEMGNTKAKRLYEAFLPECYQRPETDQSAEIFIRDKYDRKKYMDKVINIQMLRKEKSCDNIPKEPVVFEKMKLTCGMRGAMVTSQIAMMRQQQSSMMGVQQNSMIEVQQNGMMGAQGVTAQPSGMVASSYMTGMSQGMIGQQQHGIMGQQLSGMMGQQQVGGLTTLPHQQVYGAQQSQQLQWNISQMTQHMAGMNLYNTNGMMGSSSPHMGGSTNPSSVHMTAHIWK